jgi:hypothetical protein
MRPESYLRRSSPPLRGPRAIPGFLLLLALIGACGARADDRTIAADERVLFFPGYAWRDANAGGWSIPVHGIVFEPERRALKIAALRAALELAGEPQSAAERAIFESRARAFLVDHERGKRIGVRVAGRFFEVGESGADGHVRGEVRLTDEELAGAAPGARQLSFRAVTRAGDSRAFRGTAHVLADTGVSVISDLDDTIKVSNVRDRRALLRATFFEPFRPVEGMAAVYRHWAAAHGARFHYVTASPWQLYEPLAAFAAATGFPAGTWHMKQFRVQDGTFVALLDSPEQYKPAVLEPLLRRFPGRRFVLVGDSGERDPEIYGEIARKFPDRVVAILIRDVTGESVDAERYQAAFRAVPGGVWRTFREAREIRDAVPN